MTSMTDRDRLDCYIADVDAEDEQEKRNREAEEDMPRPDCLCADHFPSLRAPDHDRLLAVDRDVEQLVVFMEDVTSRTDNFRQAGEIKLQELREFVAMHNWQHPTAMHRLVALLDHTIIQPHLELVRQARVEHRRRQEAEGATR